MLVIALAAIGVITRYVGRQRGQRGVVLASWVMLAMAACVVALAHFITTPREALLARTRALLDATAPLDTPRVLSMLDSNAILVGPGGDTWLEFDQVRSELEAAHQRYGLAAHSLRYIEAQARGDEGVVEIDLRTTLGEGFGAQAPIPTKWLLGWRRTADGTWMLHRLQWLELMNQPPPQGAWR